MTVHSRRGASLTVFQYLFPVKFNGSTLIFVLDVSGRCATSVGIRRGVGTVPHVQLELTDLGAHLAD
jgi:hypothetical protein